MGREALGLNASTQCKRGWMAKEMRCKCKLCGAKHRKQFGLTIRQYTDLGCEDKFVCNDCASEYRKIFFNFKNRKDRNPRKNTLFDAFEKGWLDAEREEGLVHRPIPKEIQDYYDKLLFQEGAVPSEEEILKTINDGPYKPYKWDKIIKKRNGDERISEDS